MLSFQYKEFAALSVQELYEVMRLRNEVFVVEQECVYQDADGKDLHAQHLLGMVNNELAAYVRILAPGISYPAYCSIGRVVVSPAHRCKQYGIAIMKKAIEICQEQYDTPIKISGQCYLEGFYTDLGFKVVTEEYLEDDIPHYGMVLG